MARQDESRAGGGRGRRATWVIIGLVLLVAVIAGANWMRAPGRLRPAPTRPAPTRPAPAQPGRQGPQQPSPSAQAPSAIDLERGLDSVRIAIEARDWARADQDVTRLRQTWDGFRPTVRGTARADAIRSFESHLDLLAADVRARNSPQALREVGELRRIATTFGAAPSG
ncbi:MAG: hypothetical protein AB1700_08970 [Bacillota bacterium]